MKTLILVLIHIFAISACVPAKDVDGVTSSGNINASAPYLWSLTSFPIDLKISTSFNEAEKNNIIVMTDAWEDATLDKLNYFKPMTSTTPEVSSPNMSLDALGKDGITGVYRIAHWPTSLPGSALAVTQLFGRRYNVGNSNEYVRIEHADILVNNNLYSFYTGTSGSSWEFDFKTVILHELGHFLGLGHKASSSNSVMIPSIGPSTVNRTPTNIDTADMATHYNISLSSGAGSAMAAPSKTYKPNNVNDLGKEVRVLIELHDNGECVHKENGAVTKRHPYSK